VHGRRKPRISGPYVHIMLLPASLCRELPPLLVRSSTRPYNLRTGGQYSRLGVTGRRSSVLCSWLIRLPTRIAQGATHAPTSASTTNYAETRPAVGCAAERVSIMLTQVSSTNAIHKPQMWLMYEGFPPR
jgi:hypothetical protein